jgi:hypothetical protein
VTAKDLGLMVEAIRDSPSIRTAVDWRTVFAGPTADVAALRIQLTRITKDRLLKPE